MATFTSGQMETAWDAILAPTGEIEWVDVLSTATGEYYRFKVTNGGLYHWNRSTGTWDLTTPVPASLIAVVAHAR